MTVASLTHVVISGDTLGEIARKFGVGVDALAAANPQITNPDQIFVGQVLTIPAEPSPVQPRLMSMTDIRGVLQVGGFRTESELATMSAEDQRNTLIVELDARTGNSVAHYQSLNDRDLAGVGAVLVVVRKMGFRSDADLRAFTDDGLRNLLIVEVDFRSPLTVPELQALSNLSLVAVAISTF